MCCWKAFHFDVEVVFPTEKEFVVVGVSVWTGCDYSPESPVERIHMSERGGIGVSE